MTKFKPVHLAIATLVFSYLATTGFGAALFPFKFGQEQLAAFLWPEPVPFAQMNSLGSLTYWTILLSIVVMTPLAARQRTRALADLQGESRFPKSQSPLRSHLQL